MPSIKWITALASAALLASAASAGPAPRANALASVDATALKTENARIVTQYNAIKTDDREALRKEIEHLHKLSTPGQALVLNLSDPEQLRFVLRSYKRSGRTPANAAQLFKTVAFMRLRSVKKIPSLASLTSNDDSGREPLNAIAALGQVVPPPTTIAVTAAGTTSAPAYSATGLSTVENGTAMTFAQLQLYDAVTQTPFGDAVTAQQFGAGQNLTVTQTATPPQSITAVGAYLITTIQKDAQSDPVTTYTDNSAQVSPSIPPYVDAPKDMHGDNNILVCLSRTSKPDDNCDYGPYESATANPIVQLPVQGHIDYPIAVDPSRKVTGYMHVWAEGEGGSCRLILSSDQFNKAFSVAATNPQQLLWKFYHMDGTTQVPTASFGRLGNNPCWTPDKSYGFLMDVFVNLKDTLRPEEFFVTTVAGPVLNNATRILPLNFTWGCFAAGTKVLMADGSTKAVEDVEAGDKIVADSAGRVLTVREKIVGTENHPLIAITTDRGQKLSVTSAHAIPILGAKGKTTIVQAKELRVGQTIYGADMALDAARKPVGYRPVKITAVARQKYDGKVYNFVLGRSDLSEKFGVADTTVFADGILAGDNAMQGYWGLESHRHPKTFKQRLGDWYQDYQNADKIKN